MRPLLTLMLVLLATAPGRVDEAATIELWYAALAEADGKVLGTLLAPDAAIELQDLGVTQTTAEFVASMEEWKAAIAGGTIRHKPDGMDGAALAYRVCYDFPGNDLLTREVFTFDKGLVTRSVQRSLAQSCDGF